MTASAGPTAEVVPAPQTASADRTRVNVVLVSLVIFAPLPLARSLVPWWWGRVTLVFEFIGVVWAVWRFIGEDNIKTAVRDALKNPTSTRQLLAVLLGMVMIASHAYVVLPRPDDPVVVFLPYGGELFESLATRQKLVVTAELPEQSGEPPRRATPLAIGNTKVRAVYIGWPAARIDWMLGEDEKTRLEAVETAFRKEAVAAANELRRRTGQKRDDSQASADLHLESWVGGSSGDRVTVFAPEVKEKVKLHLSTSGGRAVVPVRIDEHPVYEVTTKRLQYVAIREVRK